MSTIIFLEPEAEADVAGPERHYAHMYCKRMLAAALNYEERPLFQPRDTDPLPAMATGHDGRLPFSTWLRIGDGFHIPHDEQFVASLPERLRDKVEPGLELAMLDVILNTALAGGSDAVKLLARIDGQCEANTWVEGKNRAWLAKIIRRGVLNGVLRDGMGWDGVVDLLERSDNWPVVVGYSITGHFPFRPDHITEKAWKVLDSPARWGASLDELRKTDWLEMKPETWDIFYFGFGVNGYEIREIANKLKAWRENL